MPRIAIVDDSRLVRSFLAGVMRAKGHETVEVEPASLFEVLKVLRESPVDLLMADYLMPDCPGESLVRACREDEMLRDLPILMVSAHRDDDCLIRLQKLGISGFLLKPVDAALLADKVAEALAG
ncbi:MAG TPA: response regulator [Geothrix sp.]|jgi:two-component system chemotaxis response regulator CheY